MSKIAGAMMLTGIFGLIMTGCRKDDHHPDPVNIPDILKVPEKNKKAWDAYAKGVQIYQVQRSAADPTVYSWVNIAPSAILYSKPNFTDQLAIHFAGPSWKQTKGPDNGNTVVARKLQGTTEDVNAIQWLLLKTVDSLCSPNNRITYIQRLETKVACHQQQELMQRILVSWTASPIRPGIFSMRHINRAGCKVV